MLSTYMLFTNQYNTSWNKNDVCFRVMPCHAISNKKQLLNDALSEIKKFQNSWSSIFGKKFLDNKYIKILKEVYIYLLFGQLHPGWWGVFV
jgi:hypothetical protein